MGEETAYTIISFSLTFPLGKIQHLLVRAVRGLPFFKSNYNVTNTWEVFEEHACDVVLMHPCLYTEFHIAAEPETSKWCGCQCHSRNTDNDFVNRANSWPICFPTPFDKVCSPETRSSAGTAAVSSKKQSRSTYCLLSPRLSSGVHPWVLSWHLLLSHEWKNPSLKSTTTHLECNLSLPVLKLKISVSL